jgi:transposase
VHYRWYDRRQRRVRDLPCADYRICLDLEMRRVDCRKCGAVKRERLDFLVDNALHTKRFALYVGRRCRSAAVTDVADELNSARPLLSIFLTGDARRNCLSVG